MSSPTRRARVALRHVVLAEDVELTELGEGACFVPLADPPPVRSVLALSIPGEDPWALEITRVVEVPQSDALGLRGCYARPVEAEGLAGFGRVGTEHLDAALPADDDAAAAGSTGSLGTPAPVVDYGDADLDANEDAGDSDPEPRD